MAEYEIFPNPPIAEAVIDIRTILPDSISITDIDYLCQKVEDRFPKKSAKNFFGGKIKVPGNENSDFGFVQSESGIIGYILISEDESEIVQFRMDGFTYNKLRPYQTWNLFYEKGHELWELYLKAVKPSEIRRIGLRYINHIKLPLPFNDFNEYILTNPRIAEGLVQGISSFFMRFVMADPELKCHAVVTQTIEPHQDDTLPFIFDIDVFKEKDYTTNTDQIWIDFKDLKKFKNDIFFKSITDKTKELFK
ncbi:MAG: TIGR04255 family protein [Desulfococcaceae bacterium]|jgi:uncharacterized protein (TIGR04255 family)|nr:TIGR04255 family protein [Desulfococcaceae bacterium]